MKQLLAILSLWAYTNVHAQNNDSAKLYFKKGVEEKASGRFLVAAQAFEKAIKYNPSFTEAFLQNALTQLEMKKGDQAKALFIKVNELDPSNKVAINELMNLYYNHRQFAKAIEFVQKCSECENSTRIMGMSYYQQENYIEAEKALKAAISKKPGDAEVAFTLARNYLDMEEYRKAAPYYEMAIKLDPSKNVWMYELGLLYYNLGDYKNAMTYFMNAANNGYVQSNDFNENLGYASVYTGEFEKGENLLMTIWAKKPASKDILRGLAEALFQQHQYDRSLYYCQKLLEIDAKDGKALYQAGLNFQKKGEKVRGQQMCDKAIQLDPSLSDFRRKKEIMGM